MFRVSNDELVQYVSLDYDGIVSKSLLFYYVRNVYELVNESI